MNETEALVAEIVERVSHEIVARGSLGGPERARLLHALVGRRLLQLAREGLPQAPVRLPRGRRDVQYGSFRDLDGHGAGNRK